MITSIASLLACVLGFAFWLVRRRINRNDEPGARRLKRRREVAKEILDDDGIAATHRIDSWLVRMRGAKGGISGPKHPKARSWKKLHP
jgi:hypothetical protein